MRVGPETSRNSLRPTGSGRAAPAQLDLRAQAPSSGRSPAKQPGLPLGRRAQAGSPGYPCLPDSTGVIFPWVIKTLEETRLMVNSVREYQAAEKIDVAKKSVYLIA